MNRRDSVSGGHRHGGIDTEVRRKEKENRKLQLELRSEKEKLNSTRNLTTLFDTVNDEVWSFSLSVCLPWYGCVTIVSCCGCVTLGGHLVWCRVGISYERVMLVWM